MTTVITHYAVIMDHPNVTLIAAGPEQFCRRALAEWIDKHPLTPTQDGEVLTREVKAPEPEIDRDCPHAGPFRYCNGCQVNPCPIGLGRL